MIDGCGRTIDHLRLSLTDHCNLACRYCVPEGAKLSGQMMDGDFAKAVVQWLTLDHGIRHIRLTGGEPLLHPELILIVEHLASLGTLHEITLTTNAQGLAHNAAPLHAAGLTRINVSLDTLDPAGFAHVTRGGKVGQTLAGIEAAIEVGLTPVKINVVAQRGLNGDQIVELAEWGLARGCIVRFLEVMPIGPLAHVTDQHLISEAEILDRLSERFELRPIERSLGQPANDYAAKGKNVHGIIGVIASTTRPFCSRCRRLRVTSRGLLVPCVHDSKQYDLTRWWNGRSLDLQGADRTLEEAILKKEAIGPQSQSLTMLAMGG